MKIIQKALFVISLASMTFAGGGIILGGGLNISSTDMEEEGGATLSMRMGYNAGLSYELAIMDQFSFIPGVSYETRGQKAEGDFPFFGKMENTLELSYIQIPLLAQYNIDAGAVKIGLFAGPDVGVLLSAETYLKLGEQDTTIEVKDDMNTLDLGLSLGAGIEIPAGPGAILIQPSYYLGFLNAADDKSDDPATIDVDESMEAFKNRNIKIKLAYKIPFN